MKKKKILAFLIGMFAVCIFAGVLAACSDGEDNYDSVPEGYKSVKVVYELEGGEYKNSTRPVTQYYKLELGKTSLIKDPSEMSEQDIMRPNYHIENWSRTKREDGSYSDPWDFDSDRIDDSMDTLTLYCVWARNVVYSYNVCYWDEEGGVHVVSSYTVSAGAVFNDSRNFADSRSGYTAERKPNAEGMYEIVYYGEDGEVWDPTFTHPGGEESVAINVFVKYIEGDFSYVTNAQEFIAAANKNEGVWLCDDIDLEGASIDGFKDGAGRFRSVFYGNGHKVSNFTLTYDNGLNGLISNNALGDNVLCISLFGNLERARIENVSFENVSLDVNATFSRITAVYVAPLGILASDSVVENVSFTGTFTLSRLSNSLAENYHCVTDSIVWQEGFTGTNCTVNVTYTDNRS